MKQLDADTVRSIVKFEIWFFAFRAAAIAQTIVAAVILIYRSH